MFSNLRICDSVSAVHTILRDLQPAAAAAGPNQVLCETDNTVMAGNTPTNEGTGIWTLRSGTGSISQLNNPLTPVTGLGFGNNVFRWTITSKYGVCTTTDSDVTISRNPNPADLNGNVTIVKNPVCYNTPGQIQISGSQNNVKYYLRSGGVDLTGPGNWTSGNGGTITLTTPNLTTATSFEIHAIMDVTNCDIIFGPYTINVNNQFPLAQLQSNHNICAGNSTTISVNITGGTGPYSITIDNGIGTINIMSAELR